MNDMESLGLSESTFISKLIVAKTDGHDECEDGQCLEVQSAVNYAVWNPGPNRVVLIIRDIAGGQKVFIKTNDPRLVLDALSMTTAIEEAGFGQMDAFGENEQHFLLRDIAAAGAPVMKINLGFPWAYDSVDISSWISSYFGAPLSEFKVTAIPLVAEKIVPMLLSKFIRYPTSTSCFIHRILCESSVFITMSVCSRCFQLLCSHCFQLLSISAQRGHSSK